MGLLIWTMGHVFYHVSFSTSINLSKISFLVYEVGKYYLTGFL